MAVRTYREKITEWKCVRAARELEEMNLVEKMLKGFIRRGNTQ